MTEKKNENEIKNINEIRKQLMELMPNDMKWKNNDIRDIMTWKWKLHDMNEKKWNEKDNFENKMKMKHHEWH